MHLRYSKCHSNSFLINLNTIYLKSAKFCQTFCDNCTKLIRTVFLLAQLTYIPQTSPFLRINQSSSIIFLCDGNIKGCGKMRFDWFWPYNIMFKRQWSQCDILWKDTAVFQTTVPAMSTTTGSPIMVCDIENLYKKYAVFKKLEFQRTK